MIQTPNDTPRIGALITTLANGERMTYRIIEHNATTGETTLQPVSVAGYLAVGCDVTAKFLPPKRPK